MYFQELVPKVAIAPEPVMQLCDIMIIAELRPLGLFLGEEDGVNHRQRIFDGRHLTRKCMREKMELTIARIYIAICYCNACHQ